MQILLTTFRIGDTTHSLPPYLPPFRLSSPILSRSTAQKTKLGLSDWRSERLTFLTWAAEGREGPPSSSLLYFLRKIFRGGHMVVTGTKRSRDAWPMSCCVSTHYPIMSIPLHWYSDNLFYLRRSTQVYKWHFLFSFLLFSENESKQPLKGFLHWNSSRQRCLEWKFRIFEIVSCLFTLSCLFTCLN